MIADAKDAGFTKRTLDRAKLLAGARATKRAFDGGWEWSLHSAPKDRHVGHEDRQTRERGNLGSMSVEDREHSPNVAKSDEMATLDEPDGNLASADAGEDGKAP